MTVGRAAQPSNDGQLRPNHGSSAAASTSRARFVLRQGTSTRQLGRRRAAGPATRHMDGQRFCPVALPTGWTFHSMRVILCSMPRLVASDIALRALLLLSQRASGMRTSEVADALEISHTGAVKALDILVGDGLASSSEHRFELTGSSRTEQAVRFAIAFLPVHAALAALARGNEAVEFAGVDDKGALVVFHRFSEPAAEGRMRDAVAALRSVAPDTKVGFVRKEDLRRQLPGNGEPRRRATAMRVLAGTVDRTFPDRTRHGDVEARSLGRLTEAIAAPSARRLRALARDYGLRRILAFGSATRADFRPGSDIDLLVEPLPGHRLGLDERVSLIVEAEKVFGRDVDLLTAPVRRASLAQRITRDGVVLYDAAR